MLQTIRDRSSGWFAYAIILLISIPFALWGINHYFEGGGKQVAAEVDSHSISIGEFEQAYRAERVRIAQMFGGQLPSSISDKMIKQAALRQLIQEAVMSNAVQRAGYRTTNKELLKQIVSFPVFQKDGHFSESAYKQILAEQGMTPGIFEEHLRKQLSINQFESGVVGSAFITSKEADAFNALNNEQRNINMAVIPLTRFLSNIKLTPGLGSQYYDAHKSDFMSNEQVRVSYLRLNRSDLKNQIKPTSDELKQYYQKHGNKFMLPRHARAAEIVLDVPDTKQGREKTLALASRLRVMSLKGRDFSSLAKHYSQNADNSAQGGSLGVVSKQSLPSVMAKALFSMKAGAVSKPIEYGKKVYLLKLYAFLPAMQAPYAHVMVQVRKDYISEQSDRLFNKQLQRLSDLAYEHPGSLEPAAKSLGLTILQTNWFGKSGGESITSNPKVVTAAFSKPTFQDGTNSSVIQLSQDDAVVLRIADKQAPKVKPFKQVESEIKAILERKAAESEVKQMADHIRQSVQSGKNLKSLADENHLTYRALGWITRSEEDIPSSLVNGVFKVPPPENGKISTGSAKLGNGGYAVFSVSAVKWPKSEGKNSAHLMSGLAIQAGQSELSVLVLSMEKSAKIKIYPNNLNF